MIAEDWLKLNAKREDTSLDELNDFIWTSNVTKYMEEYARHKVFRYFSLCVDNHNGDASEVAIEEVFYPKNNKA